MRIETDERTHNCNIASVIGGAFRRFFFATTMVAVSLTPPPTTFPSSRMNETSTTHESNNEPIQQQKEFTMPPSEKLFTGTPRGFVSGNHAPFAGMFPRMADSGYPPDGRIDGRKRSARCKHIRRRFTTPLPSSGEKVTSVMAERRTGSNPETAHHSPSRR